MSVKRLLVICPYPEGVAASMIKNDLDWAAANRDRIIAEWQRRYESKSAK